MWTGGHDVANPNRPTGVITIAATQRTGSTLVSRALGATGLFGEPREYLLNERLVQSAVECGLPTLTMLGRAGRLWRRMRGDPGWMNSRRFRTESLRRYLEMVAARHAGPTGIFCWKVMWNDYRSTLLDRGIDPDVWGVPNSWIRVRREDRLRQAVSFARAWQSRQWTASQSVAREASYDAALIARCESMIAAQEAGWDQYFARQRIEPLQVTYESLNTDYEATITRILDGLGYGHVAAPPPATRRQADEQTEQWVERYMRDRPSSAGG